MSIDRTEQEPAVRALTELMAVLDTCITELGGARARAEKLLEELRVSLFAQSVGTPRPVSEQRVYKAIDALIA